MQKSLSESACSCAHVPFNEIYRQWFPKTSWTLPTAQLILMEDLSTLCSPLLATELHGAKFTSSLEGDSSEERYASFIQNFDRNSFFKDYPQLESVIANKIAACPTSTSELLARISHDNQQLGEIFNQGKDVGDPIAIHRGQQGTYHIEFTQVSIVYIPYPISRDQAFNALLNDLNTHGLTPPLKTLTYLNKELYGWRDDCISEPYTSPEAQQRFFQRLGSLVALEHLLGISGSFRNTQIEQGEHPIITFWTGVLQPVYPLSSADTTSLEITSAIRKQGGWDHLCRQNLDAIEIDTSRIHGYERTPQPVIWQHLASDNICQRLPDAAPSVRARHLIDTHEKKEHFLMGYRACWGVWQRCGFSEQTLTEIAQMPFTVPLRTASCYQQVLKKLAEPSTLQFANGISDIIDCVPCPSVISSELLACEREQLLRIEWPLVTIYGNTSSLPVVMNRLATWKEDTLNLHVLRLDRALSPPSSSKSESPAIAIGSLLEQLSFRDNQGNVCWQQATGSGPDMRHALVNHSLYNGKAGMALFFSALYAVHGQEKWKSLALDCFKSLPNESQILGMAGAGGTIYAIQACSGLLDDPSLLTLALDYAKNISNDSLSKDLNLDVIGGSAGLILSLLALWDKQPADTLLQQAHQCGLHLAQRIAKKTLITGMSHGAAGIAYALLKLHSVSPHPLFQTTAETCLLSEQRLFSPQHLNWPAYQPERNVFLCQWCHGAAGIGLARLAILPSYDTPDIRIDIEHAIQCTLQHLQYPKSPTLCCGTLGLAAFLNHAGKILNRPPLRETAAQAITTVVKTLQNRQWKWPQLDLMQGLAGIGYATLSQKHREIVFPNPLLLD